MCTYRFEGVPLVTPNGDVLIRELNFEVSNSWLLTTACVAFSVHVCPGQVRNERVGMRPQWMWKELSI